MPDSNKSGESMRTPRSPRKFPIRFARQLAITLLLVGALFAATTVGAQAATIAVGTTVDELDGDADCSLREAIQAANTDAAVSGCVAGSGADTIAVPAGFYQLTRVGAGDDGNATGDLDVASDVTIRGIGAVIDGNDTDRVLHVLAGTVLVEGVVIQNGRAPAGAAAANCIGQTSCFEGGGDGEEGGGILTQGGSNLTLRSVTVANNEAGAGGNAGQVNCPAAGADCESYGGYGGNGGGVSGNGSLTIERSLVTGNRSGTGGAAGTVVSCGGSCYVGSGNGGDGGGVIVTGASLTLVASTVDDNETVDWAGGVYCHHNSSCTIRDTTIVGNSAGFRGGGLTVTGAATTASVTNTTVSSNTAGSTGGGVSGFSGTLLLDFVTVAGNSAGSGGGGGIQRSVSAVTVRNSIVADNINSGSTSPDCSGIVTSGGYNHVESLTGCTMALGTGDVTGGDPGLLALGDNGGPTDTRALGLASSALNAIPTGTNGCGTTTTDQRSAVRPDSGTAACDKGAFEREGAADCPAALPVCETATKSKLSVKDATPDAGKDQLNWKFQGGSTTLTQAVLGDPPAGTVWNLCLYHDATLRAALRTDDPLKWAAIKTKGYQYKDKNKVPTGSGLKKVLLKVGEAGKTQAQFIGKGDNLPDPLPLSSIPLDVTVVARNSSTATCFSATYLTAKKNLANVLQAP
jgi:CSLREA domain-containing protein